ncbi:MAG: lipocalin family protein [Alistipes sp.]|jgi:hypothetical protein|nr:lipocalin family protein [Alistipes sp.]MBO5856282.1 lipocalin family protein [Alistipes sp.]
MRHFKLLFLAVMSIIAISCEKPVVDNEQPLPQPDVTYETIAGAWQLTEWRGEALSEQTFLYIEFDDESRRFEMWDNIGSMYTQHKSGTFSIAQNDQKEFVLTGTYDNGVGDWANVYTVRMMAQGEKMVWYAEDENSIFSRISEIPELN